MKIEIVKILDRGTANKERLWLRVLQDTNLQFFIVFDTTYTSTISISNLQRHAYWFYPKDVKAGDNVILHTKQGIPSESKDTSGTTNHYVFWGLDKTIWNNTGDCAVLFEINTWQTSQAGN